MCRTAQAHSVPLREVLWTNTATAAKFSRLQTIPHSEGQGDLSLCHKWLSPCQQPPHQFTLNHFGESESGWTQKERRRVHLRTGTDVETHGKKNTRCNDESKERLRSDVGREWGEVLRGREEDREQNVLQHQAARWSDPLQPKPNKQRASKRGSGDGEPPSTPTFISRNGPCAVQYITAQCLPTPVNLQLLEHVCAAFSTTACRVRSLGIYYMFWHDRIHEASSMFLKAHIVMHAVHRRRKMDFHVELYEKCFSPFGDVSALML